MAKKSAPMPVKRQASTTKEKNTVRLDAGTDRSWLTYLLIVLGVTLLTYVSSFNHGLVNWDDDPNIKENANLAKVGIEPFGTVVKDIFDVDKGNVIGNYNPLPILTFAVEKKLSGDEINPKLIHINNVLLHLLTVAAVFFLLLRLNFGNWGSFFGAMLFGIHPMRVESVAWATERKDVLFAVFFFAALILYVRWLKAERPNWGIYIGMLLLALLSLFSKVQAVTLPLTMFVLDYWFARKFSVRMLLEKVPFFALSLVFGLINLYTLKVQGSTNDDVTNFDFVDRLCIGAYSFSVYLYKLFLPYPMSPLYPYPQKLPMIVYLSPVFFFAFWGLIYLLWRKNQRIWVFGAMFFFLNVMFLLQVLGAGQGFLADRFTYVPYFGFFAIMAWYLKKLVELPEYANMAKGGFAVVTLIFCVLSYRQIQIWKNGETLWTHVMKFEADQNSLPYWNRGQYYRNVMGNYDAALKDYSDAVRINPKNPELYNSRGKTYFDMAMSGKYGKQEGSLVQNAIKDYSDALNLPGVKDKTKAEILINRGAAMGALQNYQQAIIDLTEGIKLDPTNKNGYFNRSIAYFGSQMYDKALGDYQEYLKIDPYNANIWYESGMLLRSMNRNDEALTALNNAIKYNPKLAVAYLERARANAQKGNKQAAGQDYQRAQGMGMKLNELDQRLMGQ